MACILLVDDDLDQLSIRREILEMHGYRVLTASSVEEALAKARAGAPSIVVTDLRLPRLEDGVDLIQRLPCPSRVIVLTGSVVTDLNLAAFRVLTKPCPTTALLDAVAESLKDREWTSPSK